MNQTSIKTNRHHGAMACLAALIAATLGGNSLLAADRIKADNTNDLNLTTSWSGGVVPGAADVAVWDNTATTALTNVLGTNMSWQGIRITNPGGAARIDATSTNVNLGAGLTIGAAGIDLSSATQDLIINAPVTIRDGAFQTWQVAIGRTLTLAARPSKAASAQLNSGVLSIGTTGTVKLGTNAVSVLADGLNNPYGVYGSSDWAATDATGTVVPAAYQIATAGFSGATNWDITSSVTTINNTADALSVRFNDPGAWTVTVPRTRTFTARGVLITPNAGPGTILRDPAGPAVNQQSFVRATGATTSGLTFNVIHNGTNDFTLACNLSQGSGASPTRLVKSGPGNLILAATNGIANSMGNLGLNGPNGGIVINGGTVTVGATNVNSGTSNATHTINLGKLVTPTGANQLLCSTVNVNGSGTNSIRVTAAGGTVFIASNIVLSGTSPHLEFNYDFGIAPSGSVAPLSVTNLTVNSAGVVDVLCAALTAGTTNPIVKYASLGGAGSLSIGYLPPRVTAHLETNVANSTIDLVVDTVTQPLRWAKGSANWDLNTSTNWVDALTAPTTYTQSGAFGDTVQFEDSQSVGNPITVTLNANLTPASVTVNATKNYTISGSGGIAGSGSLTKQGSGSLTLGTANTFAGGANLNGGAVVFSALNNLGSGAINFGGGTLQYNGNTDDISVRTVTLGAGGGTINVGASTVAFTKPIGNNGAGGLTKLGAGVLKLIGTNLYSGSTVVSNGTLWLSPDGSATRIPNSPTILVASGASLDVATMGGLTLSASASQTLRGSGSVNGDITVPGSTTVSPANTNVLGTLTLTNGLIASGGTLVFDVTTSGSDLLSVGGALTLNSGTIKILASGLTNGSYKLIGYAGGLGGALANMALNYSQSGKAVSLADSGTEISLVVADAPADNLKWAGVGADWDLIGTLNWLNGASPWSFTNGALVTFDESGVAVPNVNLTATLSPSSVTVSNTTDYTFAGSGKVSGASGLTKDGTGTLTVLTLNDNFGATTISAGKVQVGNGGTSGELGTGNITNNAALVFQQPDSRTVAGSISGSGSLTQEGTALLSLGADSTYTGPTTIAAGGSLSFGAGSVGGVVSGTSAITNDGALVLNSTANWTLSAPISGTGALIKSNSNTVVVGGVNTYANGTTVAGGVLKPASASAWPGGNLTVSGGTFDVNGLNLTVNALAGAAGSQRIVNNTGSATNVLTLGNANATGGSYSGVIADNDGTGGKLQVLKIGTGTQTLGGNNAYSGGTVVSNGILRASDFALGSSPVTLSGGTLDLTGATMPNNINVTAAATLACRIGGNANIVVSGAIAGTNRLTVLMDQVEVLSVSSLSGFTGTFDLTNSLGMLRLSAGLGSSSAVFDLGTGSAHLASLGSTNDLGALLGASGTFLEPYNGACFFRIGALGQDTAFEGTIRNAQNAPLGRPGIIKVGSGTLTLAGDNSLSTGDFIVQGGTLSLSNLTSTANATNITISAGAVLDIASIGGTLGRNTDFTLSGAGTLRGSLDLAGGGTLRPGDTIGNLTVTNTATLGGAIVMELNRTNVATNDMLTAVSITAGGDLTVTNLGPVLHTGDKFKLFSQPVSGSFASVTLPVSNLDPSSNVVTYVWTNKLDIDGSVEVLSGYVTPVANTNADLASLVLTPAGALTPTFDSNVVSYTASEAYANSPITVTPTSADPAATIQVIYAGSTNAVLSGNPSGPLALDANPAVPNVVAVRVTAADLVTVKTYTVTVTRQPSLTSVSLGNSLSGGNLTLSWPLDHTGWRLQVQTNSRATGLKTNWFDVVGAAATNQVIIPVSPAEPTVFFRLTYP